MQITHLGHSTLLLDVDGYRILIDPGVYTPDWEHLDGLDALLVTHAHPDHFDASRVPALLERNPGIDVGCEAELAGRAAAKITTRVLADGDTHTLGPFTARINGGLHATIHPDVPPMGNVGLLIEANNTTLYHPGDSYDHPETDVDLLAVPINAPWCDLKDTIAFVRACAPAAFAPIHDALLSAAGRSLYVTQVGNLSGVDVRDMAEATPHTL